MKRTSMLTFRRVALALLSALAIALTINFEKTAANPQTGDGKLRIIAFGAHPDDYHPDHRYTGILVQDAAYMVTVPFICPETPPMKSNPIFMYYTDRFMKPNPSQPDIAVSIDAVMDKKLDALAVMESQFL